MHKIDIALDVVSQLLKYIAAILLGLVAVLIAADVAMRFVFNAPIIGVAEIVANGILIIAFLQLTYAVRIDGMLRSELLISKLSGRPKSVFDAVTAILGALLFILIAWASWDSMVRAIAVQEFEGHVSFPIPTWPVRVAIVSCSILAAINYVMIAIKSLLGPDHPTAVVGDAAPPRL
ncbi:TRAP transporter small permease [Rhizobium rhizophilum]|uniref:TRAP transporter small permease protein n=1 Tax=Rhizobium rhizophilum TaxID=1850373 RepID=A0ABY2QSC9_9HYPH|nr:TRAP transporter small permease [Rhizobium rhizophilum]THV12656.1 TRAP transporter small permease [Rhizobium rhizophilum]